MAGMTYGSLVGPKSADGSIKNWINYNLLPVEAILTDAQAMIYSLLRVREMRTSSVVTLAVGASSVPLPTGFLDPLAIIGKDGIGDAELVDEMELERLRLYGSDGTLQTGYVTSCAPRATLDFNAATDSARQFSILYYAQPAPLSLANQTNFLTMRYPHILRAMTSAVAADFRHDDANYTRFFQRATTFITAAAINDDLSRRGMITPRGFHHHG